MDHLISVLATLALALAPLHADEPTNGSQNFETATFTMYCYWTGEATLGRVDGVMATRIGHWGGEIVQVDYDPEQTDIVELARTLEQQRSIDGLVLAEGAPAPEAGLGDGKIVRRRGEPRFIPPKHSLRTRHPELWELDLSEEQAIALNSWSYFGGPMPDVLTDEQKRVLADDRRVD